ncbi:GNAT family N-acetyltransferase, partial [Chloroflexota bacterium]
GIPWYYRQFGYEMVMTLGGGRVGYEPQVPKLKDGEADPYRVRPAKEADLPFIAQVYERGTQRSLVACLRDESLWQYELAGRREKNVNRRDLCVVETTAGEPVGFVSLPTTLWNGRMGVTSYELRPGASWLAVSPSVVRHLWETGTKYADQDPKQEMGAFAFFLGTEHPVYHVLQSRLPHPLNPYAWYLRVPDVLGFVRHVAPVLERRLAESVLVGYSGELKISLYRDGLRLVFEEGRLTGADLWQPTPDAWGNAAFPDRTFLQLLFGYRSLDELKEAFADCWTGGDEARVLLGVLFPKQASEVWAVS